MIASHDSSTWQRPLQWWARLCPFLWRTQDKPFSEQLSSGTDYYDIRVRRDGDVWRTCHGLVDFPMTFRSLDDVVSLFCPCHLRIILERGDDSQFLKEVADIRTRLDAGKRQDRHLRSLRFIAIKKDWTVLYDRNPRIVDRSYVPWHSGKSFLENIRSLRLSTIRRFARRNPVTDEERTDMFTFYFHDFI